MYKISLPCACDIAVLSQHIYFGSPDSRLNVTPLRDNRRMRRTPTCPKQDQNAVHYGMVGLFCV